MKRTALIISLCLLVLQAGAQAKFEKHFNFQGKNTVKLDIQIADSINIQTWDKNEVYALGTVNINENKDNEAYSVNFSEEDQNVVVDAHFKDNYFKGKDGCCLKSDIFWTVFIPEKSKVVTESINANITVKGSTGPVNLKSISGFIDYAVPASKPAELDFSTVTGTVFTNLMISPNGSGNHIPSRIHYKMNDGGDLIKLETISGDIFFRKAD
jgi:hypothetical protein